MGIIRPATPGFLCTLTATVLLVIVSFCVPYFRSVYFLKANIDTRGVKGSITFGTLGYCTDFSNGTSCSSPRVGYELDINSLVGNNISQLQIPTVVVRWLTYALVLHIVAAILAAGSALFGLLAHVREMSMACFSTCVSGFAAAVALLAFIFDVVLFFTARARINSVGGAEMGNAIWLTLAAWILLFFSGCFYTVGRCCISKRKPRNDWSKGKDNDLPGRDYGQALYAEQMRLDAVKAEADRKARQNKPEGGLPPFPEMQPLTGRIEGDHIVVDSPYKDQSAASSPTYGGRSVQGGGYAGGGYVAGAPGSRAVDEYYSPTDTRNNSSYPPQPRRQGSTPSVYPPSTHSYNVPNPVRSPPPAQPQYLAPQQYPDRYGSPNPRDYGHASGGTTYHSAASHQQYPSGYSGYEPEPQPYGQANYSDPYNVASPPMPQGAGYNSNTTSYYTAAAVTPGVHTQNDRSYTLGGDRYGANSVPPLPEHHSPTGYMPYPGEGHYSPSPLDTNVPISPSRTSPVKGPRPMSTEQYDDSPPRYEQGSSNHAPAWGTKN